MSIPKAERREAEAAEVILHCDFGAIIIIVVQSELLVVGGGVSFAVVLKFVKLNLKYIMLLFMCLL